MYEQPELRLELQNMKYTVIHALQQHNHEIEKYVEEKLKDVVDNFDYEKTIKEMANDVIRKSVENAVTSYFSYGEGNDLIKQLVAEKLIPKKVTP